MRHENPSDRYLLSHNAPLDWTLGGPLLSYNCCSGWFSHRQIFHKVGLFRPSAKSYIVHVLDSRKRLLQLWSASSSSRSPCRSCSVSFKNSPHKVTVSQILRDGEDVQSAHGFWPWRDHDRRALRLWCPQRHCPGPAQPDVPVSATIKGKVVHVHTCISIRNDSNLRILLASIEGLHQAYWSLANPSKHPIAVSPIPLAGQRTPAWRR